MPMIQLDTDPALFEVETPEGRMSIDGLELQYEWAKFDDRTDMKQLVAVVRELAKPEEVVAWRSDRELYAFGGKVILEVARLGKDAARSHGSPESTASLTAPQG